MVDSGVGGLTVARAVLALLPDETLHYVGDTAHAPYGPQSPAALRRHVYAMTDELVGQGVKALVIACNSATAACMPEAARRYDVPVVEVVTPAVRRAVATTRNGRVGVIGTQATIGSGAYERAFAAAAPDVAVTSAACPRFAEFVERGVTTGRQLLNLAESYLAPLTAAGVDTLVLGCTHYPMLAGLLSVVTGPSVTLVSSAEETALEVYRVLTERDLLAAPSATGAAPQHVFRTTGPSETFQRLGSRFLGLDAGALRVRPIADPLPGRRAPVPATSPRRKGVA